MDLTSVAMTNRKAEHCASGGGFHHGNSQKQQKSEERAEREGMNENEDAFKEGGAEGKWEEEVMRKIQKYKHVITLMRATPATTPYAHKLSRLKSVLCSVV